MRKQLIIYTLLFTLLSLGSIHAQDLRITRVKSRTNLSFDINKLYNYNIYERNRWGAGFNLTTPLKYDSRYGTLFQNSFVASVYAAYGTGDHAWKYGTDIGLLFPRSLFRKLSVVYQHDLLRVGSHSFDYYNIFNTTDNSTYFSSHFSGGDRLAANVNLDLRGPFILWLGYDFSRERYLFNAHGFLFPSIYDADAMSYDIFHEIGIDLYWGDHWKFGLLADIIHYNALAAESDPSPDPHYVRFLAQYSNSFGLSDNHGRLSLFAQGGAISDKAPVSRRFDLGGTGSGHYYFNNSFLTVRPNTFMTDAFALVCLRYTMGKSLWHTSFSQPHPFAQLNAMWGTLYGDIADNGYKNVLLGYNQQGQYEYIAITAPSQGLLEPALGIDNLIHWGLFDFGVAAAYQLTPKNSHYHINNFLDKFAVMCVAKLVFEYQL